MEKSGDVEEKVGGVANLVSFYAAAKGGDSTVCIARGLRKSYLMEPPWEIAMDFSNQRAGQIDGHTMPGRISY